ncbi:Protein CBR-BUS-18 [Caenorhabditis briggsae]|uniref:Protein CBR-BUS-18 n=1 Tax=Caenorhabditis briggsae TaxID=6238 RepID=A8Y4B4_CAEBR|nr:Protein CBR-BUS-18 [Caenorhabditis briggsae]CAP39734.2 Protein CBR-BUS-18 [Caenorhabditis briggsae]
MSIGTNSESASTSAAGEHDGDDEERKLKFLQCADIKINEKISEYIQVGNLGDYKDELTPLLSPKHVPLVLGKITKEAAIATHSALHGGMSPEKEQQIREIYDRLDIDNDGTIDIRDLTLALKHETPHIPSNLAPVIMSKMSPDDEGRVDFYSFSSYVLENEQKLAEMFADMDRNHDGLVDVVEMKNYCKDIGVPLDDQKAQDIVNKMDQTGSASVGLKEFQDFMLLYPSSDLKDIVDFWRHNLIIDIGEDSQIPEDFSQQEMQDGIWWRHLVAGGLAGAVSRSCTAPFDRIKVYLQVNSSKTNRLGVMSCLKLLYAEGGLKSLWRGNGINVVKIAPESAIKFMFYDQLKRMIQKKKGSQEISTIERLCAGSAAGAISQSAIYPMEVMKTRLALRKTGQLDRGVIHFAHKMYTKEGIRCFYKGYLPNLIGIIPYAGIDLAIYETLKRTYVRYYETNSTEPGVLALLACGTCSSTCGQLASYPFALVRTRLHHRYTTQPDTMFGQFKHIVQNEGLTGLYRGITPNFLKVCFLFRLFDFHLFQNRLDWMYMWCALYQINPWLITSNKISLKAQLKKLPGAGFGMAAAQFVFLERNAEVDKKSFDDAIDYFKNIDKKYQILLFPEGTDKSEWTTLKSREFAKKNGLRNLDYVLYPRTTGFLHLLNKMREREYVDYIYDITIAYPYNIVQSEVDLVVKGASPREVHFHIRKIPISQVPLNEQDASRWLTDRWTLKEQLLHQFYSEEQPINRQFPVERGDGVWRSWKEPRRHFYVKVTALCFWTLVIGFCSYHIFFVRTLQLGFLYFFIISTFLNWKYGGIDKFIIGKWQTSDEARSSSS